MRYFKPLPVKSKSVIDRHMKVVNEDEEFQWKYFGSVSFKKVFQPNERKEAFDFALGESGVFSNFLKIVAVKFGSHIKTLVVGDFAKCEDGKWRIHIHWVVRCENQVACRRVKSLWRFREYGNFEWKVYRDEGKAVPYCMNGHQTLYWSHPACPKKKNMCRGKKGCVYERRGSNDLLV